MRIPIGILSIFLFFSNARADEIDFELHSGAVYKMLREMTSKTNASDSLNLPANASSIRENITDNFSCENRTYGYYADVENECQLFHVCLPSQTASGRNITYRWSFICPAETVFNQEVRVCTRPIDSIPCEDSDFYYDLNKDIGKIPKNDTKTDEKPTENITNAPQKTFPRRKPERKQNLVLEELLKEVVDKEMAENLENYEIDGEVFPEVDTEEKEDYERLALERSMGANRFRFKADV